MQAAHGELLLVVTQFRAERLLFRIWVCRFFFKLLISELSRLEVQLEFQAAGVEDSSVRHLGWNTVCCTITGDQ